MQFIGNAVHNNTTYCRATVTQQGNSLAHGVHQHIPGFRKTHFKKSNPLSIFGVSGYIGFFNFFSIVHGHSCMKPAFLFYLVLVLLQDIILNCLSLSVVMMCRSIVLLTGLSISGTAYQVILLMLVAFLYSNTN